jgi:hypothetical protein
VALVRTEVLDESVASIIRVKRISEVGIALVVGSDKSNTVSHPRRWHTSYSPPRKPQILHRLGAFQNGGLILFGPMRTEVTGGLRILHNEELRDLYASLRITGMKELYVRECACSKNGGGNPRIGYWWEGQGERDDLEDQDVIG